MIASVAYFIQKNIMLFDTLLENETLISVVKIDERTYTPDDFDSTIYYIVDWTGEVIKKNMNNYQYMMKNIILDQILLSVNIYYICKCGSILKRGSVRNHIKTKKLLKLFNNFDQFTYLVS